MSSPIDQIIGFQNLTALVQNPVGGVPDLLPPGFTTASPRKCHGKTANWVEVAGTRQTARLVQYGSPSVRRGLSGVSDRSAIMMHTFEHILHPASILMQLRNLENTDAQRMGQQTVAFESNNFGQYFKNLRLSTIYSMLTLGHIYYDGSGNLLPTSSGAVTDVNFRVPTGNTGQLDVLGAGAIISASWATSTTDIAGQLESIHAAAVKLTGYPLQHAFYGANIRKYLNTNDSVKEMLKTDSAMANSFRQNVIPEMFGLQWHPMTKAFFADSAGTNQSWWSGDMVVFTPEPSPDWYELLEGTYAVPTNINVADGDAAAAAVAGLREVPGMFSYAKVLDDPPSIKQVGGDTFLPVPKVIGSYMIADVTP